MKIHTVGNKYRDVMYRVVYHGRSLGRGAKHWDFSIVIY